MKNLNDKYLKNIFLLLFLFLCIVVLFITYLLADVLVPVFIAIFSAMFLYPFINKLHKTRIPNWLSTLIVVLIFIITIALFLGILLLSLSFFIKDLNNNIDELRKRLTYMVDEISENEVIKRLIRNVFKTDITQDQIKQELSTVVSSILTFENLINFIRSSLNKTMEISKSFILYVLALVFVIPGISRISEKVTRAFPNKNGIKVNTFITNIIEQIQNYMVAKSIVSLIVGFSSFIICLIFGVKYALLWGFMIFILNFVPYIGSIIAFSFPIIQASFQYLLGYYPLINIIIITVLLIFTDIIVAYIVEPKFFSRGVNLSPIVIFTGVLVWGYIWGMVGVILSVPIMSAINLICQNVETLKPISTFISAKPKIGKINKPI